SRARSSRNSGPRSAHSGCGRRLDFAHQSDFARRGIGILVLPEIFLRKRIDVRNRAVFRDAPYAAANLDVTVWVVGIDDGEGHGRTFFQVTRLDPSLRGVHPNETILVIAPDRRHLRRSIRHDGSQIRKRLLPLQQVEVLFGNDRHGTNLFAQDSATRAKTHPATLATFAAAIWDGCKLGHRGARPAE